MYVHSIYYNNASFTCRLSALLRCRRVSGIAVYYFGAEAEHRGELRGRCRYSVRGWMSIKTLLKNAVTCATVFVAMMLRVLVEVVV